MGQRRSADLEGEEDRSGCAKRCARSGYSGKAVRGLGNSGPRLEPMPVSVFCK